MYFGVFPLNYILTVQMVVVGMPPVKDFSEPIEFCEFVYFKFSVLNLDYFLGS